MVKRGIAAPCYLAPRGLWPRARLGKWTCTKLYQLTELGEGIDAVAAAKRFVLGTLPGRLRTKGGGDAFAGTGGLDDGQADLLRSAAVGDSAADWLAGHDRLFQAQELGGPSQP